MFDVMRESHYSAQFGLKGF